VQSLPLHDHASCEFFLTTFCNLNCTYCIARDLPKLRMSHSIGLKALDLFIELSEGVSSVELIFTGGEPLLEFSTLSLLISQATRLLQKKGIQVNFVIKTNGTILSDKIITFFKKYNIKVVVSIDGTSLVHDNQRITNSGKGTHSIVSQNLLELLKHKINTIASITVHPNFVSTLEESVNYLNYLGIHEIDIGPAYGTVSWSKTSINKFIKSLQDVASYVYTEEIKGNYLNVGPFYRESEHVNGILANHWGCHAGVSHLAFLPNGHISGCSALAMLTPQFNSLIIGDIINGLDQQLVDGLIELSQADLSSRKVCQKCNTSSNCTGGCLAINYSSTGYPFSPPQIYCKTIAAISKCCEISCGNISSFKSKSLQL